MGVGGDGGGGNPSKGGGALMVVHSGSVVENPHGYIPTKMFEVFLCAGDTVFRPADAYCQHIGVTRRGLVRACARPLYRQVAVRRHISMTAYENRITQLEKNILIIIESQKNKILIYQDPKNNIIIQYITVYYVINIKKCLFIYF